MVTAVEDRSRSKSDRLSCGVLVRISCLAGLRRAGWRAVELGGGKVRDYRRPGRRCQKLGERGRSRCTPGDHVDSFDDMASFVIDSVAGWLIRDGAADLRRGARHDDQSIAPCCRHGNGARAGQDDCSGGKGGPEALARIGPALEQLREISARSVCRNRWAFTLVEPVVRGQRQTGVGESDRRLWQSSCPTVRLARESLPRCSGWMAHEATS